jgi:hypothetical protein
MRALSTAILAVGAAAATVGGAAAGSSTIGVLITTDRDPGEFAAPKDTKYQINGGHTFDSGLSLGGSFEYRDRAFSTRTSQNLEGTVGYRVPANSALSIFGTAGLGEHWRQNPSAEFPYYVFRVGADLDLNRTVTWNVVSFRYRNAFDPSDNYNTPQLATGFTCKVGELRVITATIMRNWRDGAPSSTGVSLGLKQGF